MLIFNVEGELQILQPEQKFTFPPPTYGMPQTQRQQQRSRCTSYFYRDSWIQRQPEPPNVCDAIAAVSSLRKYVGFAAKKRRKILQQAIQTAPNTYEKRDNMSKKSAEKICLRDRQLKPINAWWLTTTLKN